MSNYLVTQCADHGVTVAPDQASATNYVRVASLCASHAGTPAHDNAHRHNGTSCWTCCPQMRVALHGEVC